MDQECRGKTRFVSRRTSHEEAECDVLRWHKDSPLLVIEDDKKIARIIKIYLEEAGYRVIHAEKGQDAIASAAKEKPLLVIVDLMLPDIGGEQVIQESRGAIAKKGLISWEISPFYVSCLINNHVTKLSALDAYYFADYSDQHVCN